MSLAPKIRLCTLWGPTFHFNALIAVRYHQADYRIVIQAPFGPFRNILIVHIDYYYINVHYIPEPSGGNLEDRAAVSAYDSIAMLPAGVWCYCTAPEIAPQQQSSPDFFELAMLLTPIVTFPHTIFNM